MNNIPYTSYIFIGITSLVLTYATIADTEKEIIIEPSAEVERSVETVEAKPEASVETVPEASVETAPEASVETVEAKPVSESKEGGKKRKTKKRKTKKQKRSNKSKN